MVALGNFPGNAEPQPRSVGICCIRRGVEAIKDVRQVFLTDESFFAGLKHKRYRIGAVLPGFCALRMATVGSKQADERIRVCVRRFPGDDPSL